MGMIVKDVAYQKMPVVERKRYLGNKKHHSSAVDASSSSRKNTKIIPSLKYYHSDSFDDPVSSGCDSPYSAHEFVLTTVVSEITGFENLMEPVMTKLVQKRACAERIYERECKEIETVRLVGEALSAMAACNDGMTIFDAERAPKLRLCKYLNKLMAVLNQYDDEQSCPNVYKEKHSLGFRIIISALVYINRWLDINPHLFLTMKNIHRLMAVAMMLCSKYGEDAPLNNEFWACISGVNLSELNRLEMEFYKGIHFVLSVESHEFDRVLCCVN